MKKAREAAKQAASNFKAPTPPFWKWVRNVGVLVGLVSTGVLTSGVALAPTTIIVLKILAGVGGAVATGAQYQKPKAPKSVNNTNQK